MASLWNPYDLHNMALPPCHYSFQIFINNGTLDLLWNQRSVDVFLGLPYDIAMYGLLLLMFAKGSNYKPGRLICSLGDCHIYNNHTTQVKKQLTRNFRQLPDVQLDCGIDYKKNTKEIIIPTHEDIHIFNYNPHPPIKALLNT